MGTGGVHELFRPWARSMRARLWNTRGWILAEMGGFEAADESNQRCMEIAHGIASLRMTPELVGSAGCLADVALLRRDGATAASHLAVSRRS
jgi:hypothetical protein